MHIESMPLDELVERAHAGNPKEHDVEGLMHSFKRFGFVAPPTLDESSGVMVAGHGRVLALVRLRNSGEPPPSGVEERSVDGHAKWFVPVVRGISFETESERDAYVIADNQHVIAGGWDLDKLRDMLGGLDSYEGLGFGEPELSAFGIGGPSIDDPDTRDAPHAVESNEPKSSSSTSPLSQDEIPDAPKNPVTKRGDRWRLGDSLLICADVVDVDAKQLAIGKVGFGFTSPPYNAGKNVERNVHGKAGAASRYLHSDEMDDDEYAHLLSTSLLSMLSVCRVACVNLQSLANNKRVIARWLQRYAEHLIDRAVWVKTTAQPAINVGVFNSKFEDLYFFSPNKRPKRVIETARFHGTVPNVVEGPTAARDNDHADIHGATMPVHLAQWGIEQCGALADYVVDPFGGTGTTLVVATQLGKRAALVELSPAYCDVIIERWKKTTGGTPERA